MAFANLFGMGGSPLCSIARGQGKNDDAEEIMGNSFALLVIFGPLLVLSLKKIFYGLLVPVNIPLVML